MSVYNDRAEPFDAAKDSTDSFGIFSGSVRQTRDARLVVFDGQVGFARLIQGPFHFGPCNRVRHLKKKFSRRSRIQLQSISVIGVDLRAVSGSSDGAVCKEWAGTHVR